MRLQFQLQSLLFLCVSQVIGQKCGTRLDFSVVADLDKRSRDPDHFIWRSRMLHGQLVRQHSGNYTLHWSESETLLETQTARNNRSLELSELVWHKGEWWTVCDVTGFVYTLNSRTGRLTHQHTIMDGGGTATIPAKLEWMAEGPDGSLWMGSTGKPWKGTRDSEWVKQRDSRDGLVKHHDWGELFNRLREVTNTSTPGYLWHEAVHWWAEKKLWVFAPRKESSSQVYEEVADELRGSNLLITVSPDFKQVKTYRIGSHDRQWGWSSIRALPHDDRDLLAGLRVTEHEGHTQTTLTVFDLNGRFYLEPEPFTAVGSEVKFEGLDFSC